MSFVSGIARKCMGSISGLLNKPSKVISYEIAKTGTKVSRWSEGAYNFKKVEFGSGNLVAKNSGLKDYVVKTDKNGKSVFNATYTCSKGDISTDLKFDLSSGKDLSPNQNYVRIYLRNMLVGRIIK